MLYVRKHRRVVIASDPHLAEFVQFNRRGLIPRGLGREGFIRPKYGDSSRLHYTIDSLLQAALYAELSAADGFVIPGDVLFTTESIEIASHAPIARIFKRITSRGLKVLLVLGDHDDATVNGRTLLEPLRQNPAITMIDRSNYKEWLPGTWQDISIVAVPYFGVHEAQKTIAAARVADRRLSRMRDPLALGVFHCEVNGKALHPGRRSSSPFATQHFPKHTMLNVNGHYHQPHYHPRLRLLYAGGLSAMDFSDTEGDRGFWDVTLTPGTAPEVTFLSSEAPRFVVLDAKQPKPTGADFRDCYVRVINVPPGKVKVWKNRLAQFEPLGADVVPESGPAVPDSRRPRVTRTTSSK